MKTKEHFTLYYNHKAILFIRSSSLFCKRLDIYLWPKNPTARYLDILIQSLPTPSSNPYTPINN